jgi:hypothetical protein
VGAGLGVRAGVEDQDDVVKNWEQGQGQVEKKKNFQGQGEIK